jgi:hypothetical protein
MGDVNMQDVKLTTYFDYVRTDEERNLIRRCPKSVLDILDLPSPKGCITAAYGHSSASVILGKANKFFAPEGLAVCPVTFDVARDVGPSTRVGISNCDVKLADVTTLNLLRLHSDLRDYVQKQWHAGFLKAGGDEVSESKFIVQATSHPELISELRKAKLLKHINCFIYPVKTDEGAITVATVFKNAASIELCPARPVAGEVRFQ